MAHWWKRKEPGENLEAIPWLAPRVVARLEEIVQPDFEILEHGSGGSTLWFAERCQHVTAVENNPDWQQIVTMFAPENVSLYTSMGSIEVSQRLDKGLFDLLLIDGEPVEDRAKWITAAQNLVKPGGWVVLDNANRPEYVDEREVLKQIAAHSETHVNNEMGTVYLVTDFYRLPGAEKGADDEDRTEPAPVQPRRKTTKRSTRRRNAPAEPD